jgi:hypothetical protein
MAKTKKKPSKARATATTLKPEMDGVYFLKLVLYLILGSLWLKLSIHGTFIPIPGGMLIGLLFVRKELYQIDRKVEYAMLLAAMLVGFYAPFGLYISA